MELQEALGDVTRLNRALAESKDANKSAEDVAAAESKMVDELRRRLRELEEANLFSIQQLQETESKLDQLRRAQGELKQSMDRQVATVDAQLAVLREGLEALGRGWPFGGPHQSLPAASVRASRGAAP